MAFKKMLTVAKTEFSSDDNKVQSIGILYV